MKNTLYFLFTILLFLSGCKINEEKSVDNSQLKAPSAKILPEKLTNHGDTRIDNYFWMRLSDDQKNSETPDNQTNDVLGYLNDENAYLKEAMKHTEVFQEKLYNEIVGRIKKDDQSVPVNDNGYSYYSRFEEGADYALYCRKNRN